MSNKLENEKMSEKNTSRRNLLKKAYKMPLLISLGAMTVVPENVHASGPITEPPPPAPPITNPTQSTFDPFPN